MHTVIIAFDNRPDAQRALDRLVERGFDRDNLHLQSGGEAGDRTGIDHDDEGRGFFDSIAHFFSELFGDDDSAGESSRYAETIRRGGTVLVVDAADEAEAERARALVVELGGSVDLDERSAQWQREGWQPGMSTTAAATAAAGMGDAAAGLRGTTAGAAGKDEAVVPVVKEELAVGKRTVEGGGVRVVRRVRETPVREMVRLHEERVSVQRRPVDRPAADADLSDFKEGTIEMRESREEPVVSKRARVVEEVVVDKQSSDRTEAVEDTVRRSDVEVERLQPGATKTPATSTAGAGNRAAGSRQVDARVTSDNDEPGKRGR